MNKGLNKIHQSGQFASAVRTHVPGAVPGPAALPSRNDGTGSATGAMLGMPALNYAGPSRQRNRCHARKALNYAGRPSMHSPVQYW